MKVFLDGAIFSQGWRGGILRTYQEILPRMAKLDASVQFTLYLRRKLKGASIPSSSRIHYLKERSLYPKRLWHGKREIVDSLLDRAYCEDRPDIFHSTFYTRPPKIRTPFVVSVYDMIHEVLAPLQEIPERWRFVEHKRQCIQAADLILTNSQFTTRDLPKYCPVDEKKIVTVPLGVSAQFSPIQDDDRKHAFLEKHQLSRPFFLYVGARRNNKNYMGLFRAYAGFKFANEIDLVTVGDDDPFRKEESIYMSSLLPNGTIRHLKMVNEDELVLAYNTALAFIFPSLYEGFGLPVLEAMACGTPVLASHSTSIPEVAGDAALYFNPLDPEEMRVAMEAVLQPGTAQSLREKGLARAAQFNWDDTARTTLQAYQRLI